MAGLSALPTLVQGAAKVRFEPLVAGFRRAANDRFSGTNTGIPATGDLLGGFISLHSIVIFARSYFKNGGVR